MYLDTSVVLSLYVTDVFTPKAEDFCRERAEMLTVSAWVDLEIRSALSFLVRTERLSLEGAQTALGAYDTDRRRGVYRNVLLNAEHFAAGGQVLVLGSPLRAGDALHLGAALVEKLPLVTSDKTLHKVAEEARVGCTYLPGEP